MPSSLLMVGGRGTKVLAFVVRRSALGTLDVEGVGGGEDKEGG
jgi:hypothetical protein